MARHKTVSHLAATPPVPAAPRLAASLFTVLGELAATGLMIVGVVSVAGWLLESHDAHIRARQPQTPPRYEIPIQRREMGWRCGYDRHGEFCRPVDRWIRPYYARGA
jgi:hypothetical protein